MKDKIVITMSEVEARVLQSLADLCLYSVETCDVFDEHYRTHHGDTVGYPPVLLKGTPSQAVQRACSAIAIALATANEPDHIEQRCAHPCHNQHKIGTCPLCGEYDDLPF